MADIPTGFDLARKITFPADTSVLGFGVITKGSSVAGQLRMGLYADDGTNQPGAFVTRTGVITGFDLGENVFDVAPAAIDSSIDHWIAIAFQADTPVGADTAIQVESCFIVRPFANAIDNNGFGVPTCNMGDAINLFVVVQNL